VTKPAQLLDDSGLFVEQATWLAPHLSPPTIGAFACWLAPWLREGTKPTLETLYRLHHPVQSAAEEALVEILESAPEQQANRWLLQEQCTRNTDWPSSLALAHPLPATRFVQQRSTTALDVSLLAGLASVARQWSYLLTEYGGYTEAHPRVAALRKVAHFRGRGQLTSAHLKRLTRSPDLRDDVRALRSALELMSKPLATYEAREALSRLARQLSATDGAELENRNDALEVSVILSIARAAESLGWTVTAAAADRTRPKPTLKLALGELRCAIIKGRFQYPEEPDRRARDVLATMQREGLGLASTDGQPDVVISFWHAAAPEKVLFAIADAKRNEVGDGIAYLKKSIVAMTAYMVAFAEPLGVRLSREHGGFAAPLMPTATLFLHQGAEHDAEPSPRGRARSRRRRHESWLECLDRRHYARMEDGAWQPAGLNEWFSRLAQAADAALRGARAVG
jgi:hypothetical protein